MKYFELNERSKYKIQLNFMDSLNVLDKSYMK